jgi:PAS domain S-box-containing protein
MGRAENETAEAELYRLLVENTVDIIVRGDRQLRRTYISPSCQELLGYSQPEMLGRHGYELLHPDDVGPVNAALSQLGPTHRLASCSFRMRRKDGSYIWMEGSYRYLPADGGVLAVLRDITPRKQAEAQLAEANAQLQATNAILAATLEHMTQGVCFFDGSQRLITCNHRYAELYGLPPAMTRPGVTSQEIIDYRTAQGFATTASHHAYLRARDESHARKRPFDFEVTLSSGKIVLIRQSPMEDGGWVASHEDVTERRRTEEMLHQAQKLESVGRLTAGVAHDFNNLLQTVSTALEMAAMADEIQADAKLLELLADASMAVESGGQLTQQLLTFSRRQVLVPSLVDVFDLVTGMGGLLRQACGESILLSVLSAGGPFPSRLDVSQFRSALLNLAINARDAMPNGGRLEIDIEAVTLDAAQAATPDIPPCAYVRVDMRDSGHGIAADILPLVFEPFFTTKSFGVGSGLGLAQVYGFAHQSGGSVLIASTPGQGTTVTLLLPRADAEQAIRGDGS